ncbi:MAG: thiamine-phosphate kinase [Saprospiraceae bacterium]
MKRTDVNQLGEFGLIDHLTRDYRLTQKSTIKGIGDDAAVIDYGKNFQTVVSTDMLVEHIHFDVMYTPLKHLGYKAVVINLSDIYAMNATPRQITVSLAISNRYSVEALEEFYKGVYLACEKYNVDLIGGDTTSSTKGLVISVTAIGRAVPEKLAYRNKAKAGDIICVSGDLGAAYLGLQIYLENPNIKPDLEQQDYLVGRLLKPEARADMIDYFAKAELIPTSMMDISDGLASEIYHICSQSDVGAFIEEGNVPIHPDTEAQAIKFKFDPITCALSGGEDYELLFTINPNDLEKVKYMPNVSIIGEIVDKKDGIMLHTTGGNIHKLTAQGWNHF